MRHAVILLLLSSSTIGAVIPTDCLISMEPRWEQLNRKNVPDQAVGGKSIVIGSITFRKKCKQSAKLDTLTLSWHGKPIEKLSGSLYKKIPDRPFVPLENNLVADSSWNQSKQKLHFHFNNNKQSLGPATMFYVVLTVPRNLERTLRAGSFSLSHHNLPEMFAIKQDQMKLNLAQL